MKQQHQPLLNLVEFAFFAAEVEPHLETFLQRILIGRGQGGIGIDPEGGDANSSGLAKLSFSLIGSQRFGRIRK